VSGEPTVKPSPMGSQHGRATSTGHNSHASKGQRSLFQGRQCSHFGQRRQTDGAFLVRDCSTNSNFEPLVLVVYHEKKVYNVKIRFVESTKKYALGTGYRSNDMFDSVADIIKFHSIFPITLVSGRTAMGNKYPDNCVLTFPITKGDVERLLQ
uniref:SH2 domain-containing protein n=1 Tax=Haplochromis burtoni TaxID=8153 RepID=A0A3Q3BSJ8_HAPBU